MGALRDPRAFPFGVPVPSAATVAWRGAQTALSGRAAAGALVWQAVSVSVSVSESGGARGVWCGLSGSQGLALCHSRGPGWGLS